MHFQCGVSAVFLGYNTILDYDTLHVGTFAPRWPVPGTLWDTRPPPFRGAIEYLTLNGRDLLSPLLARQHCTPDACPHGGHCFLPLFPNPNAATSPSPNNANVAPFHCDCSLTSFSGHYCSMRAPCAEH